VIIQDDLDTTETTSQSTVDRKRAMRSALSIAIICSLFAGCASARPVPGSLPPGNADQILDSAENFGKDGTGSVGEDLRISPISGAKSTMTPLWRPAETSMFYVLPYESSDRKMVAEGQWVHFELRQHGFEMTERMRQESIPLDELGDIQVDQNGNVIIGPRQAKELSPSEIRAMQSATSNIPWRDGGSTRTVATTVVVDDGRGPRGTTFRDGTGGTSPLTDGAGNLNQRAYEDAMRRTSDTLRRQLSNQGTAP
jgi:hypothetical protein